MENNINGKELNKKFINAIKRRRKKLFEDAKPYITTSNADDVIEKIDEENYIKKEDREEYDILMTLLSYLEYKSEPKENCYEFKGLEYRSGTRTNKASIVVTKDNALKISRLANDYEEKLKRSNNPDDKKMSIKFPVELLMLKHQGTNMPGLDYAAPEPKLASQTDEEYEEGLKTYYEGHGVDRVENDTTNFREAYPHEKINYRQDPPEITNVVQNGYYTATVEQIANNDLGNGHGDPGMQPGEEQPVVGTDRGLGRRIGDGYLNIKNLFKSKTLPKTLAKAAVIAGLGYTAVSCLIANPGVTLLVAAGATVAIGGAGLIFPPIKRGYNAIKKKIKEWLFGPELTNNPPAGGNGGNGGNNGGTTPPTGGNGGATTPPTTPPTRPPTGGNGDPDEPEEPTMTPEELNNRIAELNNDITRLEGELATLNTEIANLPDGDEKTAKLREQTQKRSEYRVKLNEVTALLHQYDREHTTGGPRL